MLKKYIKTTERIQLSSTFLVILLLVAVIGCTGSDRKIQAPDHILEMENVTIFTSEDIESADTLSLVPEQVFRDTDENPITRFGTVIADDFGRVLIGDSQQQVIHVFQQDGHYLGKIGGEGDGPGEFRWVGGMNIHDNRLFAYDVNGRRVNLFELGSDARNLPEYKVAIVIGGESWDSFPEPGFMNPGFQSVKSDGSLLLTSRTSPILYRENPDSIGVRRYYSWSGDHSHKPEAILDIPEPKHIVTEWFLIPPPFESRGLFAMTSDDRIYTANTAEILIHSHDAEGNDLSSYYYPFENRELTRREAVESVDDHVQLRDAVQSMQIPGTWPALQQMFADDFGRIWISVYTENKNTAEWWVLEESGGLLARFDLSDELSIARVDQNHLYTRETDEETGLQQVVRYRIEFKES